LTFVEGREKSAASEAEKKAEKAMREARKTISK
jgi:hypothetical protein